jgi:hypothetical protein
MGRQFPKKTGRGAELSGKSPGPDLSISKNLQIGWCGFQKKSGTGGGNYKKRADRLLRILKKSGTTPSPHQAQPTNKHQILRRSCARLGISPAKKSGP